jgi:hypothetical protein
MTLPLLSSLGREHSPPRLRPASEGILHGRLHSDLKSRAEETELDQ